MFSVLSLFLFRYKTCKHSLFPLPVLIIPAWFVKCKWEWAHHWKLIITARYRNAILGSIRDKISHSGLSRRKWPATKWSGELHCLLVQSWDTDCSPLLCSSKASEVLQFGLLLKGVLLIKTYSAFPYLLLALAASVPIVCWFFACFILCIYFVYFNSRYTSILN